MSTHPTPSSLSAATLTLVDDVAALLRSTARVTVLSGAGLSKASGIPTYRDMGGLWRNKDTAQFSHADAWKANPAAFSKFWKSRRAELARAKPNAAHSSLVALTRHRPGSSLITQNVDGLLQAAGARSVLELHGSLARLRCDGCGRRHGPWPWMRCIQCLSPARPDVVLFGEALGWKVFEQARQAVIDCNVFLVVGTSAEVYPAASLPEIALRWGAKLVVIDTERTMLAEVAHIALQGPAEIVLPAVLERLR